MSMYIRKKGVLLIDLLASLLLYTILSGLIISSLLYISRSITIVSETAGSNLHSANASQTIMNRINDFSPQGINSSLSLISGTTSTEELKVKSLTFTRSVQYKTDEYGNFIKITPSDSNWKGGTELNLELSFDDDGYGTFIITESGGEYTVPQKSIINVADLRMMVGASPLDTTESYISIKGFSGSKSQIDSYCISFHLNYKAEKRNPVDVITTLYYSF